MKEPNIGKSDTGNSFQKRRDKMRANLADLPGSYAEDNTGRSVFFEEVYNRANDDEAAIPWADLMPKSHLADFLFKNPGDNKKAIDIACGLGDNAEAMSVAGYQTTAFDIVEKAIDWAQRRFPQTDVCYETEDLFDLPQTWLQSFDLVHECYTLQALPENLLQDAVRAICGLVAPGGILLIYTRYRKNGQGLVGPPWPLEERLLDLPKELGFIKITEEHFLLQRADRSIPANFTVWKRG